MEDITIVYHVPRKRVSLINQIIKIIKRESMDFSSVIHWKERRIKCHILLNQQMN